MSKITPVLLLVAAVVFAAAPFVINGAPPEATMGLVQKIFYFHFPAALLTLLSAIACGLASARVMFGSASSTADAVACAAAELAIVFGAIVFVTGPLWGRRAWGVWWQWDARVTSTFVMWLVFWSYLLLRRFGGAGSEKLSAAVGLFGMALAPFVYWSVNMWRTIHPPASVVPKLPVDFAIPLWLSVAAFACFYGALMMTRVSLGRAEADLNALIVEMED
jgi:heme exporter protein C